MGKLSNYLEEDKKLVDSLTSFKDDSAFLMDPENNNCHSLAGTLVIYFNEIPRNKREEIIKNRDEEQIVDYFKRRMDVAKLQDDYSVSVNNEVIVKDRLMDILFDLVSYKSPLEPLKKSEEDPLSKLLNSDVKEEQPKDVKKDLSDYLME